MTAARECTPECAPHLLLCCSLECEREEMERRAVAALDALTGSDPEADHSAADEVLLSVVPPAVREAYERLEARAPWWATS